MVYGVDACHYHCLLAVLAFVVRVCKMFRLSVVVDQQVLRLWTMPSSCLYVWHDWELVYLWASFTFDDCALCASLSYVLLELLSWWICTMLILKVGIGCYIRFDLVIDSREKQWLAAIASLELACEITLLCLFYSSGLSMLTPFWRNIDSVAI